MYVRYISMDLEPQQAGKHDLEKYAARFEGKQRNPRSHVKVKAIVYGSFDKNNSYVWMYAGQKIGEIDKRVCKKIRLI